MTTSVAMTTYNGVIYIEELLDSIRTQDEMPNEVIIVDDCSTDGTYEFVIDYISSHGLENWHVFLNEKNIGWKANFREAMKKCSGDIVFLCDQDDIWLPHKIKEMKSVMLSNNNIQLLASNYEVKYEDRKEKVKVRGLECNDSSLEKLLFRSNSLTVMRPGCTYCIRKALINQLWIDDDITLPHDAILWGYAAIDETLYIYNRITLQYRRYSNSASTPKLKVGRNRRIEEVSRYTAYGEFFIKQCHRKEYKIKSELLEKQLDFNIRRKELLINKSFFKMIGFQFKNFKRYSTIRNMLSDDYFLLFNKE